MKERSLHIMTSSAMLATLRGFEEPPDFRYWRTLRWASKYGITSYSPFEEQVIINLINSSVKTPRGYTERNIYEMLAERFNRSVNSIKVKVYKLRKIGRLESLRQNASS